MDQQLEQLTSFLQENRIPWQKASLDNIEKFQGQQEIEVFVDSTQSLQSLILHLEETKQSWSCFSTGRNWGLGAKVSDKKVLINLQNMKGIRVDEDLGILYVHAGDTQLEVNQFLLQENSPYYLDVTGSSANSSVLGNTSERGISYAYQRSKNIVYLRFLSKSGKIFETGHFTKESITPELKRLYPEGIGPDISSALLQNPDVILLEMGLRLQKKPSYFYNIQAQFKDKEALLASMEPIKKLIEDGIIFGIPHIANRERAVGSILPYINWITKNKYNDNELNSFANLVCKGEWCGLFLIVGDPCLAKAKLKVFKKALKPYSKIRSIGERLSNLLTKLPNWLVNLSASLRLFHYAEAFRSLSFGTPSSAALLSLIKELPSLKDSNDSQLDELMPKQKIAFRYSLPLAPFKKIYIQNLLSEIERIEEKYKLPLAVTLNPIQSYIIEAVISIEAPPTLTYSCDAIMEDLNQGLEKIGFLPYRLPRQQKEFIEAVEEKKKIFKEIFPNL